MSQAQSETCRTFALRGTHENAWTRMVTPLSAGRQPSSGLWKSVRGGHLFWARDKSKNPRILACISSRQTEFDLAIRGARDLAVFCQLPAAGTGSLRFFFWLGKLLAQGYVQVCPPEIRSSNEECRWLTCCDSHISDSFSLEISPSAGTAGHSHPCRPKSRGSLAEGGSTKAAR